MAIGRWWRSSVSLRSPRASPSAKLRQEPDQRRRNSHRSSQGFGILLSNADSGKKPKRYLVPRILGNRLGFTRAHPRKAGGSVDRGSARALAQEVSEVECPLHARSIFPLLHLPHGNGAVLGFYLRI
jgi:hypothetical protein